MFKKIIMAFAPMIVVYGTSFILDALLHIYTRIPCIDIPFHIIGGIASAWTGLLLYQIVRVHNPKSIIAPRWLFYICLVCFTALVGILWEQYEFLHDMTFHTIMQPSSTDTVKDLLNDLIGAIIFCLLFTCRARNKKLKQGEY